MPALLKSEARVSFGGFGGCESKHSPSGDVPVGLSGLGGSLGLTGGEGELGGGNDLEVTLNLFGVAVLQEKGGQRLRALKSKSGRTHEEHVDHDGPRVRGAGDGAAEAEDLAGKEPPDETNGVLGLVVGGDRDVNVAEGRVGVAQGDDRDVAVRRLADGLVVDTGVGDDDEAGLLVRAGDLVRERSGGETSGDLRVGSKVSCCCSRGELARARTAWAPMLDWNLRTAR